MPEINLGTMLPQFNSSLSSPKSAPTQAQLAADATGHGFVVLPMDPSVMVQYVMQGLPLFIAYDRDRKVNLFTKPFSIFYFFPFFHFMFKNQKIKV